MGLYIPGTPGLGLVSTVVMVADSTASIALGAGTTWVYRVTAGGTISKIRVGVQVSSGNICLQAFQNTGQGLTSGPGALYASSGPVACPATGTADIPLGANITVQVGDWLGFGCDNATATFAGVTGAGGTISAGQVCTVAAFPAPSFPAFAYANNRCVFLVGVP
jgi:hypothetical protein